MKKSLPPVICIVGCDGSGKSTLAQYAVETLQGADRRPVLVWSRYNHFFSKPLLGLALLMKHSHRETHEGVAFGYHDFSSVWWLRKTFPFLQSVDVALATRRKLGKAAREGDVIIFERSPWDTLADVILDTGLVNLGQTPIGQRIIAQVRGLGPVIWVSRSKQAVLSTRPELRYDRSLERKMEIYEHLAAEFGWLRLANNRSLAEAQKELMQILKSSGCLAW